MTRAPIIDHYQGPVSCGIARRERNQQFSRSVNLGPTKLTSGPLHIVPRIRIIYWGVNLGQPCAQFVPRKRPTVGKTGQVQAN
jgi:hypothetical protein